MKRKLNRYERWREFLKNEFAIDKDQVIFPGEDDLSILENLNQLPSYNLDLTDVEIVLKLKKCNTCLGYGEVHTFPDGLTLAHIKVSKQCCPPEAKDIDPCPNCQSHKEVNIKK